MDRTVLDFDRLHLFGEIMNLLALCPILVALALGTFQQAPQSDEASDKLLADYMAAVGKLKSVRMDVTIDGQAERVGPTRKVRGYVALKKPSLVRIHFPCKLQERTEEFVCDGKQAFIFSSDSEACQTGKSTAFLKKLEGPETLFLSDQRVRAAFRMGAPHIVGQPTPIGGVLCRQLEFARDGDYFRLYVGTDNLPRGLDSKTGGLISEERFTNLKANKPVPAEFFKWRPPAKIKRIPMAE
jgi:outer membrane lipoprotein-sorting protein